MRLDRFLAGQNAGTRKEVKALIRTGQVTVEGLTVRDPGFTVQEETDLVSVNGVPVSFRRFSYLMLHKPAGVITATEDASERTVLDLLKKPVPKGLSPVGRLDKDTVGLLLLTNDGALSHRLLSPRHHVDKCYEALVAGSVSEADVLAFREGLPLSDVTCLPAALTVLSRKENASGVASHVQITLHEGKFHQIKRMFHARGMEVLYLKRLSMGPLKLDPALSEGEYRPLTDEEIRMLREL